MASKLTVKDFFARFPDDDTCLDHVMDLRYGRTGNCPGCGKESEFYRLSKRPAYSCKLCGHHIYPCAGTPFERTRTALQLWFYAMYLFTTTRHGVPAKELQRQLGVTYKTAWRIGHEIRKFMGIVDGDDGLSGHVEADETYVGGKPRYRGAHRAGRSGDGKTIVFGMVQRGGNIMTKVIPDATRKTIRPLIEANVAKGSVMSTDEWVAYDRLWKFGYQHETVNHGQREYARGDVHTNTLEGFWSHFKNSMRGTHRSISKQHMAKYLGEFEFRFNLRRDTSSVMFDRLIQAF